MCRGKRERKETDGDEDCCTHPRARGELLVCCWCGDLFESEDGKRWHGPYAPGATAKDKKRASPPKPKRKP
jgi:hypothetical protein